MSFSFRLTPLRSCTLLLGIALLSYLVLAIALTLSISGPLTRANFTLGKITGFTQGEWLSPTAQFSDPHILGQSADVEFRFDPWRPAPFQPASILFRVDGESSLSAKITGDSVTARFSGALAGGLKPLKFSVVTENPVRIGPNKLGVKFRSATISPRFLLLLPSFPVALRYVALLTLLCVLALAYGRVGDTVSVQYSLILLSLFLLLFSNSYPETWIRAQPLILLTALILLGGIIYRTGGDQATSERILVGRSLFVVLLGVVAGGAVLRLYGLDFGLPQFLFHPDEARKSAVVKGILETGDLNPNYFRHPSFLLYSTAFLAKLYEIVTGVVVDLPAVPLFGRAVSALLGSLSVLLLYLLGRDLYGQRAALTAAALLAVAPLHVFCSRYMKEDVSLIFFVLVAAILCVRTFRSRKTGLALSLAFVAGVAISAKYTGILALWFVALPPAAALLALLLDRFLGGVAHGVAFRWTGVDVLRLALCRWASTEERLRLVIAGLFGLPLAALGFIIVTPYSLVVPELFWADFQNEKIHMEVGHNFAVSAWSRFWMYHYANSFFSALTPVTALLCSVSCGWLVARRRWSDLFVLAAILLFYLPPEWVRAKPEPQPDRYILPCLPFLALALGAFVDGIWRSFTSRWSVRFLLPRGLAIIAVVAPLVVSLDLSLKIKEDTREAAQRWVMQNVPRGSRVLIDWEYYTVRLSPADYEVISIKRGDNCGQLRLSCFAKLKPDYVVLSSFSYDRYFRYPEARMFRPHVHQVLTQLPLIKEFPSDSQYGFHNPTIKIFAYPKVGANTEEESSRSESEMDGDLSPESNSLRDTGT